jgi:hypothetical protein
MVCTGEHIHFEWDITRIDGVEIQTPSGQVIHHGGASGSWESTPVQAGWDYLSLKGCRGSRCERRYYDVQLIDNPKWTCDYFGMQYPENNVQVCGSLMEGGGFRINGGQPTIDLVNPLPGTTSQYPIHRLVDSYTYTIPRNHFSPRARVTRVRFDRLMSATLGMPDRILDPDGMSVEATTGGGNAVPKTWVPKGQDLAIATLVHPSDAPWSLWYRQPERVLVGVQLGIPDDPDQKAQIESTAVNLFPSIAFEVKCDVAPTP